MSKTPLAGPALWAALVCCGETAPSAPEPAGSQMPAKAAEPPASNAAAGAQPPAPSAKPDVERVTLDKDGKSWAHHMGDIAFSLDPAGAMAKAKEAKRPLMLFFTRDP